MDQKTRKFLFAAAVGVVSAMALASCLITHEQFQMIIQALGGM
jgi:hypothetical protein